MTPKESTWLSLNYRRCAAYVLAEKKTAVNPIRDGLGLQYWQAMLLIETMQHDGMLSAPNPNGKRAILKPKHEVAV